MRYTQFFSEIRQNKIAPCYVFEGEEEYIKQQALIALEKVLVPETFKDLNKNILQNPNIAELIDTVETLPFMAEKRLVIVNECTSLSSAKAKDDDFVADFLAYLPTLSPSTCLVFVVRGKADGRKKLYSALKKKQAIVDFSPMNDQECVDWVQKILNNQNINITHAVAQKLVFTVGHDASLLKQELSKLESYLQDRNTVLEEDVNNICTKSSEYTVFQMVDAQVAGQLSVALELLGTMLHNGENSIAILAMLLRQYRILYHMSCLVKEGVANAQLASLLGIPPFTIARTKQQTSRYSTEKLKQAYFYLLQLEYELKTGITSQDGCAETSLLVLSNILQ